jgi:hypothetical protein
MQSSFQINREIRADAVSDVGLKKVSASNPRILEREGPESGRSIFMSGAGTLNYVGTIGESGQHDDRD